METIRQLFLNSPFLPVHITVQTKHFHVYGPQRVTVFEKYTFSVVENTALVWTEKLFTRVSLDEALERTGSAKPDR